MTLRFYRISFVNLHNYEPKYYVTSAFSKPTSFEYNQFFFVSDQDGSNVHNGFSVYSLTG